MLRQQPFLSLHPSFQVRLDRFDALALITVSVHRPRHVRRQRVDAVSVAHRVDLLDCWNSVYAKQPEEPRLGHNARRLTQQ